MKDYPMLYESIVLAAFGKRLRGEDPNKLGQADTLGLVDDKLSGKYGKQAKFGLSEALRNVAKKSEAIAIRPILLDLDQKLWEATTYNEICQILDRTEEVFKNIGIVV